MDTHAPSVLKCTKYDQSTILTFALFYVKSARKVKITILKNYNCFWNVLTLVVLASPPRVAAACSRNLDETEF